MTSQSFTFTKLFAEDPPALVFDTSCSAPLEDEVVVKAPESVVDAVSALLTATADRLEAADEAIAKYDPA